MASVGRSLSKLWSRVFRLSRQQPVPSRAPDSDDGAARREGLRPSATVEVDIRSLGRVSLDYSPERDGDPDPGEVVWTWVPYEENDGRGKDRPVLIIANRGRAFLALQLTSRQPDRPGLSVHLGVGPWDSQGRQSWARCDRVFLVQANGVRREGMGVDRATFERVAQQLDFAYGWLPPETTV